jgi:hypothetical protein
MSAPPPVKKRPVKSKKKLQPDKCRMSIDECRIKEFFLFYLLKRAERSDIHNSSIVNLHSSFQLWAKRPNLVIWYQLGGIPDGHHRCDGLRLFFFPGYEGCKRIAGDPLRTVFPHCPERSAALIYRFHLFPYVDTDSRVDWKEDSQTTCCNYTETDKSCSFHAILDDPFDR